MTTGYVPDAVEAMIALGRHDEAEPMIEAMEPNGRRLDRPWMLAVGARCRSMSLAARGDVDGGRRSGRSRPWPITSGCRCRSNGPAPSCCSASSSVVNARRTPRTRH